MSGLMFLLFAVGASVVGSTILWLRRHKPTSLDHGISAFQREMQALAPTRRRQESDGDA